MYLSLNNYLKNQLMMVLSFVASGSKGSICDNIWLKQYVQVLNEKHISPYSLKLVQLTKLCSASCRHEFSLVVQERYVNLTDAFISSNSDFLWEPVSQESYVAIVAIFIARCYHSVDGCCLFLSDKTLPKFQMLIFSLSRGQRPS